MGAQRPIAGVQLPLQTLDDIPGGGTRMTKDSQSIPWVVVNGEPIIENGALTGAVPGRVVRSGGAA